MYHNYGFRQSNQLTPAQKMGLLTFVLAFLFPLWFWYHDGVFSAMWSVTHQKLGFWLGTALFAIGFPIFWKRTHPQKYTWGESIFQGVCMLLIGLMAHSFFFYTTSDLEDKEFLNSYAVMAQYHEEWTGESEHESCDADGNCTTWTECDDYHPPFWELHHNTKLRGEYRITSIKPHVYQNYLNYFGNEKEEDGGHFDRCSWGDGRIFTTEFRGTPEQRIPTAVYHDFVNYVKGAKDTLHQTNGDIALFRPYLKPYPKLEHGAFGQIYVDRVVSAKVTLPREWAQVVDHHLDMALTDLGDKRQVDLVVYVVGTNNPEFIYALQEYWANGKKNDVIVVIGSENGNQINWVHVDAWTTHELFKIELRDRIQDLGQLDGNAEAVAAAIVDQVDQSGEHGFVRNPMENYKYLAGHAKIPFVSWMLIWIVMTLFGLLIGFTLTINEITEVNY